MAVAEFTMAELVMRLDEKNNLVHTVPYGLAPPGKHSPGCEACEVVRKAKIACPHRHMGKAGCPDCGWTPRNIKGGDAE